MITVEVTFCSGLGAQPEELGTQEDEELATQEEEEELGTQPVGLT